MSGPSTLRICLAAMAPALTEAASTRIRIQENPDTEKTPTEINNNRHRSSDIRTLTIKGNNIKILGGEVRSIVDGRLTHLSVINSNNPNRTSKSKVSNVTGSGVGRSKVYCLTGVLPSTVRLNQTKSRSTSKTCGTADLKNYVTEDFQENGVVSQSSNPILNNLRIMNQPYLDTGNVKDKKGSGCNEIDVPSDKKSRVDNLVFCIDLADKTKDQCTMVNGEEDNGKSCNRQIDEMGDAGTSMRQRCSSNQLIKRSVHFDSNLHSEDPEVTHDKSSFKMGRPNAFTDSIVPSSGLIAGDNMGSNLALFPNCTSKPAFTMSDLPDIKSRDEVRKECARKQAYLERKVDTLLRRLKRMRGKVVETHSREQLRQFVNFQHKSLQQVAKTIRSEAPGPAELKEHFLSNEEVKSMSTTELVKLVKKYQPTSSNAQSVHGRAQSFQFSGPLKTRGPILMMDPTTRTECSNVSENLAHRVSIASAELDSDATASSSGGETGDEDGISSSSRLGLVDTDSVTQLTKSKMGPNLPPLFKRSEWRWASDRAGIVSRWTWLQAQVSDLEYRIRQQSQVHRQLRASKGGVILGDPPSTSDILRRLQGVASPDQSSSHTATDTNKLSTEGSSEVIDISPMNIQAVMSNVDKQASRLSRALGNCLSPASSVASAPPSVVGSPKLTSSVPSPGKSPPVRHPAHRETTDCGATGPTDHTIYPELNLPCTSDLFNTPEQQKSCTSLSSSSSSLTFPSMSSLSALDATCQSARCRPLRSYRKRRILRTIGLHRHSQKAARLSDVKCRCSPPANPCPMCGGRYNNTLQMDVDTMSLWERISLVDASFHPVLSFSEDISLPVHCEGLIKSGQWQNKPLSKRSRSTHHYQHHYYHHHKDGLLSKAEYNNNKKNCLSNTSMANKGTTTKSSSDHTNNRRGKVLTLATPASLDSHQALVKNEMKKPKKKKKVSPLNGGKTCDQNVAVSTNGNGIAAASVIKNFSEKIKNKYENKTKKSKSVKPKARPLVPQNKKIKKKKPAARKRRQVIYDDNEEDLEALYLDQEVEDEGEMGRSNGGLSASASQSSLKEFAQQQHQRNNRRKIDNSYDINNIEIPLSMATNVPIEQPQYKEIVTPKWREKPIFHASTSASSLENLASKLEKTNGLSYTRVDQPQQTEDQLPLKENPVDDVKDCQIDSSEEDLSDESYAMRHLKYELEEKKRFRNFVQFPPVNRNRGRGNIDKLDGLCSEENSLSSRPTTPVLGKSLPASISLDETIGSVQQQGGSREMQRLRAMSASFSTSSRRDQRSNLRDPPEAFPTEPWPARSFPLPDEAYKSMLKISDEKQKSRSRSRSFQQESESRLSSNQIKMYSPNSNKCKPPKSIDPLTASEFEKVLETDLGDSVHGGGLVDGIAPLSPQSASVSSSAGDDPTDPEWMSGNIDMGGGLSSNSSTYSGSSLKGVNHVKIHEDPNDPEWLGSDFPRKNKNKR